MTLLANTRMKSMSVKQNALYLLSAGMFFTFQSFFALPSPEQADITNPLSVPRFFFSFLGSAFITQLLFSILKPKNQRALLSSVMPLVLLLVFGMVISSLYYLGNIGSPILIPLGAACAGCGFAQLFLKWTRAYSYLSKKEAFFYVCVSLLIASALRIITAPLIEGNANMFIMTAGFLIAALPLEKLDQPQKDSTAPTKPTTRIHLIKYNSDILLPLGGCALSYIIVGFIWGSSLIGKDVSSLSDFLSNQTANIIGIIIFSIAIARNDSPQILVKIYTFIGAALLLLGWLFFMIPLPPSLPLSTIAKGIGDAFFNIILWASLCTITKRAFGDLSAASLINAAFIALFMLCMFTSSLLGKDFAQHIPPIATVIYLVLFALFEIKHNKRQHPQSIRNYEDISQQIARDYGLTERETEVLSLLSRGRSSSFIAEQLTISPHTAKTYTKRIYEKIGVHSKEELLTFVDTY